jgi:hexulose-6-phosphate isomerase
MQFAFNDVGFPHDDLARDLDAVAGAGYAGVEFALAEDGALTDAAARADLAAAASDRDLDVPSVLTPAFWEHPLSSTDEATRERGIAAGEALVAAADDLGADVALVVAGVVDESTPYDRAYENARDSLRELAAVADEHGITLAVENVWNDFLLSPREFAAFVDEAAEAGPVGAYFDVGNVRRFGRPEQWIRILGDRIAAVHVKDYDADVDTADGFTYPFQGHVDWDATAAALADVGYDGWVTPEVPPYETRPGRMPGQVLDNLRAVF